MSPENNEKDTQKIRNYRRLKRKAKRLKKKRRLIKFFRK